MKGLLKSGIFIFLFDLLIILLHILLGSEYFIFHLDFEHNIPTIYQGLKLILISQFAFLFLYTKFLNRTLKKSDFIFWTPLIIIFLFLGIDELGQIHENLHGYLSQLFPEPVAEYTELAFEAGYKSSDWILIYIPLFIFFIAYIVSFAVYLIKRSYKFPFLLAIGGILMIIVPFVEVLNTSGLEENFYYSFMTLEESLEMIGTSFIFILVLKNYINTLSSLDNRNSIKFINNNSQN